MLAVKTPHEKAVASITWRMCARTRRGSARPRSALTGIRPSRDDQLFQPAPRHRAHRSALRGRVGWRPTSTGPEVSSAREGPGDTRPIQHNARYPLLSSRSPSVSRSTGSAGRACARGPASVARAARETLPVNCRESRSPARRGPAPSLRATPPPLAPNKPCAPERAQPQLGRAPARRTAAGKSAGSPIRSALPPRDPRELRNPHENSSGIDRLADVRAHSARFGAAAGFR